MKKIDNLDYAKNCVTARVYEKKMIDQSKLDRMIDAKTPEEAFKLLMDTEYVKSSDGVDDVYDYDLLLGNEIERIHALAKELFLDEKIVHLLALKYEYHNLRIISKELVSDKDFEHLYLEVSSFDPSFVKSQAKLGNYVQVPDFAEETIKYALSAWNHSKNPQAIDFAIDREYFKHMISLASEIDVPMIYEYVKAQVDFFNVSALVRTQKHKVATLQVLDDLLIEGGDISIKKLKDLINSQIDRLIELVNYGKKGRFMVAGLNIYKDTGSLEELEDARDDYLATICSETRYQHFGPEPIFAYILKKEKELSKVRIILISKLNNVPAEEIRKRLREVE